MHGQQFLFDGGHVSSAARTTLRPIMGLRAIAAIGLAAIPLNDVILKRLLAIVETVRAGDPFVAANGNRLQAVAWARCWYCSF